jgi:hypothetical protein
MEPIIKNITREIGDEFCTLEVRLYEREDGFLRLSICGSAGDIVNNYRRIHSCGQIIEELNRFFPDHSHMFKWHLNDLRAECIHQEKLGQTWTTNPLSECKICGYKLGSSWTTRKLPKKVISWVKKLK